MKAATRFVPVVLAIAVMGTTAFGQIIPGTPGTYPSVRISNTPHNLNNYAGVTLPGQQVCLPCHTPHNALKYGEDGVLWNHAETGELFTMYYSSASQPDGHSKMCLSCHDGVTAIDNYGGTGGTGVVITGAAAMDADLSNDHPIGIVYPLSKPAEYNNPADFDDGIDGGPGIQLMTVGSETDRVECSSCHNVHNNGLGKFLRVPLQQSYLCLQCHIK